MSDWKLIHSNSSDKGTTKVYQDSEGNVRIDSFNGNVRNSEDHDRVTLNTRNGGQLSGHDYDHKNNFDTLTGRGMSRTK